MLLARCQPGFEDLLAGELAARGLVPGERGGGWVAFAAGAADGRPDAAGEAVDDLCFAHAVLLDAVEVTGASVNQLAAGIAEGFLATAREERFDGPWPLCVETAAGLDGLGRRAGAVEEAVRELLKRRMARVVRLAVDDPPVRLGAARGLWVFFADFRRVLVARRVVLGGARRMADDPLAPSRSYLKVEEAYGVLGREPAPGETVVDLGAAPGGWSYSAARRGARVIAIDNGPLKGGALGHEHIEHRREDAFRFRPEAGEVFDWMFCDLVEEPHHVLAHLVEPWLAGGWCRRFVINLKFGRVDPLALLRELRAPGSPLRRADVGSLRIRHLFHDREELTVVGGAAGVR